MRVIKIGVEPAAFPQTLQSIYEVLPVGAQILAPKSSLRDHKPEEEDEDDDPPPSSKPALPRKR